MGAILSVIFNFLSNHFSATKLVLYALFTLVLPVVIWNVWVDIVSTVLSQLLNAFQSVNVPNGVSFSFSSIGSFAVWLASNLRLSEAFSALISGLTIRITVNVLMRVILR